MLKISKSQHPAHTILDLDCPQCGEVGEVTLTRFINAINRNEKWHCSDCGCDFKIEFVSLTRSAERGAGYIPQLAPERLYRVANFEAIQEGNWEVTYAKVREDGSLLIQCRYFDPIKGGVRGVDEIELLPEGVNKLKALLTRSAELRNEVEGAVADDAPKTLRTEDE